MKLHSLPPAQRAGILVLVFFLLLSLSLIVRFSQPSQQTQQQAAGTNPIQQENQLPGTTNWYLNNPSQFSNYRYVDMEGYPWQQSTAPGETLSFSVSTTSQSFTADIYRLGWYGGAGAHLIKTIADIPGHFYPLPQMDPTKGFPACYNVLGV